MRNLSMWAKVGLMTGGFGTLVGLAGCGGGNGDASVSTATRADSPVPTVKVAYTVTDLGATDYYYSYFGYISNRYRYTGVLRINDAGKIITNTANQPVLYDGNPNPLPNSTYASVSGLNNADAVVGTTYSYFTNSYTAGQWANNALTQVDAGFGNTWSSASAINDAGAIVGESATGTYWWDAPAKATLWQNGQQTILGSLGGNYSVAFGINASGTVIGWSQLTASTGSNYYDYSLPVHAFVWNNGTMTDLGVLTGGTSSDAQDINDNGQIVGSSDLAAEGLYSYRPLHAVSWTGTTISDLGTLGGPGSIAYALNNSGVIVGSGDTSTLAPQSTYYGWVYGYGSAGGGTGGGTGGSSNGSNNGSGSGNNSGTPLTNGAGGRGAKATRAAHSATSRGIGDIYVSHAFRYSGGKMEDLNAYIDASTGWELLTATHINSRGQIVGFGKFGNRQHAFLLTPIGQ